MSYYWEELEVGMEWLSPGRTVTEADIVLFGAITGDYAPLHFDKEFSAEHSVFKTRIAHGLLGLSYAMGLGHEDTTRDTVIGAYGITKWEFRGPILIGDTIKRKLSVADKKEHRKPDRGLVTMRLAVVNQRGEEVQIGEETILVRRKPEA